MQVNKAQHAQKGLDPLRYKDAKGMLINDELDFEIALLPFFLVICLSAYQYEYFL